MKLRDLFEEREAPRTITRDDFDRLGEISGSNVNDRYRVGRVAFDNEKGMGSTPNGQNVKYLGFVAELRPADFLSFVTKADRSEDAERLEKHIKALAPIAAPQLYVKVNEKEFFQDGKPLLVSISQHEGRARMWAIKALDGNEFIPVQFILNGGMRARNLNEKFFEQLRKTGLVPQDKKTGPDRINFGRIWWQGKEV
jgi:hypothetical protein